MIENPFKDRYKLVYDLTELAGAKDGQTLPVIFFFLRKQHEFFFSQA